MLATRFLISNNRVRVTVMEVQVSQQSRTRQDPKATSTVTFKPQRISMSFILNSKRKDPTIIPKKKSQTLTVNQTFTKPSHSQINSTESNKINIKRVNRTKKNQNIKKIVPTTSGIRILTKSKNKNIKPTKKRKERESKLSSHQKAQLNMLKVTGKTLEENDTQ